LSELQTPDQENPLGQRSSGKDAHGPNLSRDIEQLVVNFYTRNLSIALAGCLGFLGARVYAIESNWTFEFTAAVLATISFLSVTYFEYFYFLIAIRRTTYLIDVFAPLVLGVTQSIAIAQLGQNKIAAIGAEWWFWQALYVGFGVALLLHSVKYINSSRVIVAGRRILKCMILSSVLGCILVWVFLLLGVLSQGFLRNVVLVMLNVMPLLMVIKSDWLLRLWSEILRLE
jgi:hypothetical protein